MSVWDFVPTGQPGGTHHKPGRPKTRSPGPGERLVLAPLEDAVGWYVTHYRHKRTKGCLGERCGCQKADDPWPTRWAGYILALEWKTKKVVLALLTPWCYESCASLQSTDVSLRGAQLILTRGPYAEAPVTAAVVYNHYGLSSLPVLPYTHRDQLIRVWFGGVSDYADTDQLFRFDTHQKPKDPPADELADNDQKGNDQQ